VRFDWAAYAARLRLPARPTIDAAGLAVLQRHHRLAIPFENLDVMLGRGIAIDSESVFAKLVTAGRGGYCFEHNRLFGDALADLGFEARALLARVWLDAITTPPPNHAVTLVTIEGEPWLADAGFGGSYSPPMPLIDGAEASAPDGARFRLRADNGGWLLERDGDAATTDGRGSGEGWRAQYNFTLAPVSDDDLAAGSRWASGAADSRFTRLRIASMVLPRGFAGLTDRRYRRLAGADMSEAEISDPRVYRIRLAMMFGIDLTAEEVARLGLFSGPGIAAPR